MSPPNVISLGRLLSVPLTVWVILQGYFVVAFGIFVAAGVSDAVDGFLAKRFGMETELGRYLDPLADKALLVAVFITLGQMGYLPVWLVILVVSRDVLIIGGVLLTYIFFDGMRPRPVLISKINTAA
ncbi:MAG: CDP-alcohol phosphatidyltransferase family protein, partial [Alphaproteobacteria bacterium]|nr:CDP-alcohol phosphatidyltransferase family protein [Alphaproteobacteria bacterium]